MRGDGHRTGKGGKANIELLGIGIAHRNDLLVRVVALSANSQRVVTGSHQQSFTKGPIEPAQREVRLGLGVNVEGQRACGEQKKEQSSDHYSGDAEHDLGRIDTLCLLGRLTPRFEGRRCELLVVRRTAGWRERVGCQCVVIAIAHGIGSNRLDTAYLDRIGLVRPHLKLHADIAVSVANPHGVIHAGTQRQRLL